MKAVVVGAGAMGEAVAYDLVNNDDVEKIKLLDYDMNRAKEVRDWLGPSKLEIGGLNVRNVNKVVREMRGWQSAISCVPYEFNYDLARAAVEAGVNFVDLGGNHRIVKKQLELHEAAKRRGVLIVPDCGLAPGLTNVLTKAIYEKMDEVHQVKLYVGGLPQKPEPLLNYALMFSVKGLVNEYIEPCKVLLDGKIRYVPALQDLRKINVPGFGELEAFSTSGATSTLPETYEGKIDRLKCRTLRYPGHVGALWDLFRGLGIQKLEDIRGEARDNLEERLLQILPQDDLDVVAVMAYGYNKREADLVVSYSVIDRYDANTDLTAMQRMTAFPAATTLALIGTGVVKQKGAMTQEKFIPTGRYLKALRRRGINITEEINKS